MTSEPSREFRLLAACCRWPPAPERDAAIRSAAVGAVDWSRLLALAARHRVEGLVSTGLEQAAVDPPGPVAEALRARAREVARRSLLHAAESARLQGLFDREGLANLILKGAAVEALAYGALGRKDAWDIDLLVRPSDVRAALNALVETGYERVQPSGLGQRQMETYIALARECELRNEQLGVTVELHWGVVDGPVLLPGLTVASPSRDVAVGGNLSLRTFAETELFAYLCVHGAMHGWARLKWLADFAALASHYDDSSLAKLVGAARQLGAGACPDQALHLAWSVLGATIGPSLSPHLRHGFIARGLVRFATASLTVGGAREPAGRPLMDLLLLISQSALCGSWGGALRQFAYRAVSVDDRVNVPLPSGLGFLYPVLRLPLWLWRRLRRLWRSALTDRFDKRDQAH